MLKLAVVGAQTELGQELVSVLESRDCSVLPLATGPLTREQEEADLVGFAPEPALLEGLDLVVLAESPQDAALLEAFPGRILDLRRECTGDPMPVAGGWPEGTARLKARPVVEQVLALLPRLVEGIGDLSGTHLRSVASLVEGGPEALMEQTVAILNGQEPDASKLGYRGAFEVLPQPARGAFVEVRVPVFHGDVLVVHLRAQKEGVLTQGEAPEGCAWVPQPPTSRDAAVSPELLAHLSLSADQRTGVLTLAFDPILWGVLRPVLRLLTV